MIRNKKLLRTLALLLVACMALTMTAMAANETTYIVVTIEDDEGTTQTQPYLVKLRGESSHYLTEETPLLVEVVAIINAFYPKARPETLPSNTLWDFQSLAMKAILDEGLTAYSTGNDDTWVEYVDKYFNDVQPVSGDPELKALLKDKNSTLGDVTPNVEHKISFANEVEGDAKFGVTYTVTITRYKEGGEEPKPDVPELNKLDHVAYIVGYPDGNVRPEGNITRAEVATIFFRMLTDESRNELWATTNNFSDVSGSNWFNNAVSTLANAGIINGYPDGTFRPNAPITRAEFTKIAASFFESMDYTIENPFVDVNEEAWYYDFVIAAYEAGLINGYPEGDFRPNAYITRAEAMAIMNRTLDRHPDGENMLDDMIKWPDNPDSKWYYEDVQEATNSHEYELRTADGNTYEVWTTLLPTRDWPALEKEWSDANSAEGGDVMG